MISLSWLADRNRLPRRFAEAIARDTAWKTRGEDPLCGVEPARVGPAGGVQADDQDPVPWERDGQEPAVRRPLGLTPLRRQAVGTTRATGEPSWAIGVVVGNAPIVFTHTAHPRRNAISAPSGDHAGSAPGAIRRGAEPSTPDTYTLSGPFPRGESANAIRPEVGFHETESAT